MNYGYTLAALTLLVAACGGSGALAAGDVAAGKSEAALGTALQAIVAGKSAHSPVGKLSALDVANIVAFYAAAAD